MDKTTVQMILGLLVLVQLVYLMYSLVPVAAVQSLSCDMMSRHEQCRVDASGGHHPAEPTDNRRIIVIGDIHGAYDGLLELLHETKITKSAKECVWAEQADGGVILVQSGDLVDRGPKAYEALQCLKSLQTEAHKYSSKVVRLIGSKCQVSPCISL
jgi:hypothetical protein